MGFYAPSEGDMEAREAIAEFQKKFNVRGITSNDILITTGGAEGINLVLNAILDKNDIILLPSPSYPQYEAQIDFLEAKVRYYYLNEENEWQIDPCEIDKIASGAKAIVIINPNNPTGAVLKKETLKNVLQIAKKHNLVVIADEQVYPFYVYDDEEMIMCASLGVNVPIITIGSMSKTFFVPGWRVGWLVFNDLGGNLEEVKETIFKLKRAQLGSPNPFQKAVKPALFGDYNFLWEAKEKLLKRREIIIKGIESIKGLSLVKPHGAFYAFVRIDLPIQSDKEFILDLAKNTGILCVPGEGFGQKKGTFHFRIVFLPPEDMLDEAISKIKAFLEKRHY